MPHVRRKSKKRMADLIAARELDLFCNTFAILQASSIR
jgi:hypothetical protein